MVTREIELVGLKSNFDEIVFINIVYIYISSEIRKDEFSTSFIF